MSKMNFKHMCDFSFFLSAIFFICFLGVVDSNLAIAQSQEEASVQSSFQSPTAASLGEYGAIPVGKYTGIPQIKIPLYEVKSDDLSIPISLSYHAGGIKVNEIASWVGLGWSLNAGGVITRSIRGKPDESSLGYLNTVDDVENGWPQPNSTLEEDMRRNDIDTQPDQFFFNVGGVSGKFMFAGGGEIVQFPRQDIKINIEGTGGSLRFILVNDSGVRYIFEPTDTEETIQTNSVTGNPGPYISSWFLSRVESPQGNNIIHFYYTNPVSTRHQYTDTFMRKYPIYETDCPTSVTTSGSPNVAVTDAIYLSRIETRSETIYFDTSLRQDALNPSNQSSQEQKLDKIRINQNGTLTKSHEFSYSYFNPSLSGVTHKRLKLDAVTEKGSDGTALPPHALTYSSTPLPSRESYSIDHWGYYNGANNTYLIPYYVGNGITYTEGADREANASTMLAGSLIKIEYPTRGSTEFTFEPHNFSMIAGSSIPDEVIHNEESASASSNSSTEVTTNFSISFDQNISLSYGFDGSSSTQFVTADIELRDGSGSVIFSDSYTQEDANQSQYINLDLESGNYVLSATGASNIYTYANLYYLTRTFNSVTNKMGGGLRIKQINIEDGDGDSSDDQVIMYTYHEKNNPGTSSGVLTSAPTYYGYSGDGGVQDVCAYRFLQSNSKLPLGETQGSFVGYRQVKQERSNGNGYSWFHYKAPNEVTDRYIGGDLWPFEIVSSDWKRGYLKKEEHFNASNQKLSEKSYTYITETYTANLQSYLYRVFQVPVRVGSSLGGGDTDYFHKVLRFDPYTQQSEWLKITGSEETVYDASTDNSFKTVRTLNYQNTEPVSTLQPTELTHTNSDGTTRTTEYKYAHEIYDGAGEMADQHMLNQLYKVTTRDGSGAILRIDWLLWKDYTNAGWQPCSRWTGGPGLGTAAPNDPDC